MIDENWPRLSSAWNCNKKQVKKLSGLPLLRIEQKNVWLWLNCIEWVRPWQCYFYCRFYFTSKNFELSFDSSLFIHIFQERSLLDEPLFLCPYLTFFRPFMVFKVKCENDLFILVQMILVFSQYPSMCTPAPRKFLCKITCFLKCWVRESSLARYFFTESASDGILISNQF